MSVLIKFKMEWNNVKYLLIFLRFMSFQQDIFACPIGCICNYDPLLENYMSCNNFDDLEFTNPPSEIQTLIINGGKAHILTNNTFSRFMNLKSIEILNLPIKTIESYTFNGSFYLESVKIDNFEAEFIPPRTFYNLPKLKKISLTNGKLKNLSKQWIQNSSNVNNVDFSNNQFTNLESHIFTELPKLTTINFKHNKISNIENKTFHSLKCLLHLDIGYNDIDLLKTIENGTFDILKNLKTVYIRGNKRSVTELTKEIIRPFLNVEVMGLRELSISNIHSNAFEGATSLKSLFLSSNSITLIKDNTFSDLPSLKILSLSNNPLKVIKDNTFSDLQSLETLSLSLNPLETLTEFSFSNLTRLVSLRLDYNNLKHLPNGLFDPLINLRELYLANNPFNFTCDLFHILNKFRESSILRDSTTTSFTTPDWLKGISILDANELVREGISFCQNGVCYNNFNMSCDLARAKYGRICHDGDIICDCETKDEKTHCLERNDCRVQPCMNDGVCRNDSVKWTCSCKQGWTGPYCNTVCRDDYYGENCEKEFYKCNGTECRNNGVCIPRNSSHFCSCKPGFSGSNCETLLNNTCNVNGCKNGGTCVPIEGTYICRCLSDYYGDNCEYKGYKCNDTECGNNGVCIPRNSSHFCSCKPGFSGSRCQTLLNDTCSVNECKNGGACLPYEDTYICRCLSDYSGDNCEKEEKNGLEEKTIIIILCGLVALFFIVVVLVSLFIYCRMKRNTEPTYEEILELTELQNTEHQSTNEDNELSRRHSSGDVTTDHAYKGNGNIDEQYLQPKELYTEHPSTNEDNELSRRHSSGDVTTDHAYKGNGNIDEQYLQPKELYTEHPSTYEVMELIRSHSSRNVTTNTANESTESQDIEPPSTYEVVLKDM